MSALIETKNASIDTFSVTIRALHVGGKQMTLAVFRQLPEGVPGDGASLWGVVNYQIKDSRPLWLVFAEGEILKRHNLNFYQEWWFFKPETEWIDHDTSAAHYDWRKARKTIEQYEGSTSPYAVAELERARSRMKEAAREYDTARQKMIAEKRARIAQYELAVEALKLPQLYIAV